MPKFMMILNHPPDAYSSMSQEEAVRTFGRYQAWTEQIKASGRYVVSDKLQEEGGKQVTKSLGKVSVTDRPYTESKEIVGGYFTIRATDYEEAVAIAMECPFLEQGSISIRQTDFRGCGDE